MPSATRDRIGAAEGEPAWYKYFSEAERQRLAAEDSRAWRTITALLTAVVTLGLLGIASLLLWVL